MVPHLNLTLKRSLSDDPNPPTNFQGKRQKVEPSTSAVVLANITNLEKSSLKISEVPPIDTAVYGLSNTWSSSSSNITTLTSPQSSSYSPLKQSGSNSDTFEVAEGTEGRRKSTFFLLETKSRFYLGIPREIYKVVTFVSEIAQLRPLDILVTLKKIRTNHVYTMLGDDFELSPSAIQKIFVRSIPLIASCFQELIIWPESACIQKTSPLSFHARYKHVESIIDCFEIEIEKPSNPVNQALTWSEYKKCNTLKYLISITPNGVINFISGASGGRTSDKEMVEKSGFLSKLKPETSVMADRGFKHIAPLLIPKRCKLVRPPSVPENTKLEKSEIKESKRIASLRIHVERVIGRIREFSMVDIHSRINHNLLYLMDHIVLIVCGIVNIQGALIK